MVGSSQLPLNCGCLIWFTFYMTIYLPFGDFKQKPHDMWGVPSLIFRSMMVV